MNNASEGKLVDLWDEILERVPVEYLEKNDVPGVIDVQEGLNVNVPTTIYLIKNDDTSGVAGVLMPSGEFVQAAGPRVGLPNHFWEFDETLRYVRTEDGRVVGNSWTVGEVVWDGVVTGSVVPLSLDGEDGDEGRQLVNRRVREQSLTGDWESTGELWRAIRRGTSQRGVESGIQHLQNQSHNENLWDTYGNASERKAA